MIEDSLVLLTTGFILGIIVSVLALLACAQIAAWLGPRAHPEDDDGCSIIPFDRARHRRNKRRWEMR